MRAAILEKPGKPLEIYDDVEIIEPRAGEIRVRVRYCGICHSDLSVVNGVFPVEEPVIPGHEASGVVDMVGAGVTHLQPGDPVVLSPLSACGHCYFCQRGEFSLCANSLGVMTFTLEDGETGLSHRGRRVLRGLGLAAFAEYVVADAFAAVKVPPDVPLEEACVIGCALQTGVGAVLNIARIEEGATVLVMGLGGIGQAIVQGARLAGARRIIVSDPVAERRTAAQGFGATDLLDPAKEDVVARCQELSDGIGVDYAFEAAGASGLAELGYGALRNGGCLVCVGAPPLETKLSIDPLVLLVTSQKRICGCVLGGCNASKEISRLTGLWQAGRLDLGGMITSRRPLEGINEAFADMTAGRGIRTVLEIS